MVVLVSSKAKLLKNNIARENMCFDLKMFTNSTSSAADSEADYLQLAMLYMFCKFLDSSSSGDSE